jgi:FkbM family methyltransferase
LHFELESANFELKESIASLLLKKIRRGLYKKVVSKDCDLFLRNNDIISADPATSGLWEPHLTALIKSFVDNGYNDFFIDIGANIGLTSCQNGQDFKYVHMFEPNPLCRSILEVNAAITLDESCFKIHPYGLGEADKTVLLSVPKRNWGGAFVNDSENSYTSKVLANKDGFKDLRTENYLDVEIKIKNTSNELKMIFKELSEKGLKKGVIKIDVEGYEPTVLKGIANSLPNNMKVFIIFESWDSNFDIDEILNAFEGRAIASKLFQNYPYEKNWNVFLKMASLIFNSTILTRLETVTTGDFLGDIVLKVD